MILESLSGKKPAAIKVEAGEANTTRLKTYLSAPHTLTELLPVMQNMGLVVVDQKPYEFKPEDGEEYGYLYDFGVEFPEGVDPNALVVEPYANPFRTYPLANDYEKFKKLVAEKNVACYIINTGDFMGKKVQKEDTLGILEAVVEGRAEFKPWGPFSDIEIFEWEGFVPDMNDPEYVSQLKARMNDRVNEIKEFAVAKEGYDKLPDDALEALERVVKELN